jgi:hypothetical protein
MRTLLALLGLGLSVSCYANDTMVEATQCKIALQQLNIAYDLTKDKYDQCTTDKCKSDLNKTLEAQVNKEWVEITGNQYLDEEFGRCIQIVAEYY